MKILVSETLYYNLNRVIPRKTQDCNELMMMFFPSGAEDHFSRKRMAAELIFDEIEEYKPDFIPNDYEIKLIRKINSFVGNNNLFHYYPNDMVSPLRDNSEFSDEDLQKAKEILEKLSPFQNSDPTNCGLILCEDPFYTQQYLSNMNPHNSESALGILAAAGIEFCLPSIYCKEKEVIHKIKETFAEERLEYLDYLTRHIGELHAELSKQDADLDDVWEYAKFKISQELKIRANKFELAVSKADSKTKKSLVDGLLSTIPTIGSSLAEGKGLKKAIIHSVLKTFSDSLRKTSAYDELYKKHPEAAYVYQVKQNLSA